MWRWVSCAAIALVAALLGYWLGDSWTARLSDHRGYHQVAVADAVAVGPRERPRRVVLVVADGLRGDAAAVLPSIARLRQAGVCAATDMGPLTVSRPNYAVLSTGLESDRTGARHNVETAPLAAESLWEVAREAGRSVALASHLDWWVELFPGGFDRRQVQPVERDLLGDAELADFTVIHPIYVDDAGHDHGARSPKYRAAVRRFDAELEGLLARLDLSRDLLVVTADHGHVDRGGHGGPQPEIARVLSCFAGAGVARGAPVDWLEGTAVAPAIAVLAGLRFPRHMRAGDPRRDGLDPVLQLADPDRLGPDYLADRAAAIERFRAANRERLDGGPAALSERARDSQIRWAIIAASVIALLLLYSMIRRQRTLHGALLSITWMALAAAAPLALYAGLRGSLDLTSVNTRSGFVTTSLLVCTTASLAAAAAHLFATRDLALLLGDQLSIVGVLLASHLAHRWVYGVPLGYPIPGSVELFAPLIGASLLIAHAATAALTATAGALIAGGAWPVTSVRRSRGP